MVIVTITLSITLLQVALLYGEMHETVKYLGFIFAQVAHTFCFSVQGQRLIDHSLQLNDNVYNSSWYEIPAELRRLLLFVMRRSMQPCFLTAGKLYIFSLKSFSTVMQSSVSYFTVLASFAEILEDTFCTALAIQMLIVVALSITLLQVALQYDEIHKMLRHLTFIFVHILHTFLYSLQGQRLLDHSLQLSDKIYNSFWYEIPAETQRLLLHVMRRSMEPCILSAGKIYVFSLKSFTTVMQSSMSNFTVLASFQ
ncbi:PREDICTED: putative odorant receptor 85d [Trachymyrmex septentrionalis]|uniref:putative odorant receptor 85d n=1 Tax=Trachymyrmex septentrionalis TaxID=34720 RepID=UPI00084F4B53|nr:PREDICTED: putative odorant receptor 85d [Trachymyrmex septentrionalis]